MEIDPNKVKTTLSDHEKRLSRIEGELHQLSLSQNKPVSPLYEKAKKLAVFMVVGFGIFYIVLMVMIVIMQYLNSRNHI